MWPLQDYLCPLTWPSSRMVIRCSHFSLNLIYRFFFLRLCARLPLICVAQRFFFFYVLSSFLRFFYYTNVFIICITFVQILVWLRYLLDKSPHLLSERFKIILYLPFLTFNFTEINTFCFWPFSYTLFTHKEFLLSLIYLFFIISFYVIFFKKEWISVWRIRLVYPEIKRLFR